MFYGRKNLVKYRDIVNAGIGNPVDKLRILGKQPRLRRIAQLVHENRRVGALRGGFPAGIARVVVL